LWSRSTSRMISFRLKSFLFCPNIRISSPSSFSSISPLLSASSWQMIFYFTMGNTCWRILGRTLANCLRRLWISCGPNINASCKDGQYVLWARWLWSIWMNSLSSMVPVWFSSTSFTSSGGKWNGHSVNLTRTTSNHGWIYFEHFLVSHFHQMSAIFQQVLQQ